MRSVAVVVLLAAAAAFAAAGDIAAASETGSDDQRILVTVTDPGIRRAVVGGRPGPGYRRRAGYVASVSARKSARRIARDFALEELDDWPMRSLGVYCLVYRIAGDAPLGELIAQLRDRPEVETVQVLNQFETMAGRAKSGAADPYAGLQHVIPTLELSQAHRWSVGAGTHVTIIDTGADLDHPDLKTQIADHRDFVQGERDAFVADAHGTAIAGVIAAASGNGIGMIGVAPGTRVAVLKACWHEHGHPVATCDSFTLARALDHAIQSRTDVINLSLGGPSDDLLGRLVREALARDIVVVAAAPLAGNTGFPAELPGVLVAGAARGSQHGRALIAPGHEILVPTPDGGFDYASGSSLSAAHVSGIVALLLARRPTLTSERIGQLLTASRPTDTASVNACRALAQLLQRDGCRVDQTLAESRPVQ